MEVPLAEIELDPAQSIKRRQIVGRAGKRGWHPPKERDHLGKEGKGGNGSRQRGNVKKKKERERRHSATKRQRHHKSKTR